MSNLQNKHTVGFRENHSGILIPLESQELLHASETTHKRLKLLVSNKLLNVELLEKFSHLNTDETVILFTKFARNLALTREEVEEAVAAFVASTATSDDAAQEAKDRLKALIQKSRRRAFDVCEAEAGKTDSGQTQAGQTEAGIAIPWELTTEETQAERLAALQDDYRAGVITSVDVSAAVKGHWGEPSLDKLITHGWTENYLPKSESYKCVFDRAVLDRIRAVSRSITERESVMRQFLHDALAHGGNRLLPQFSP